MQTFINRLRTINTYILVFLILVALQKYTLGQIPALKEAVILQHFYLSEILFSVVALVLVKRYLWVGQPTGKCYLRLSRN